MDRLRVLDFDVETRPIAYLGNDFTTSDITVMAWSWTKESRVHHRAQTLSPGSRRRMLAAFVKAYDEADVVTGHFIRGFDLPKINGALLELGMEPLSQKMTSDTKLDLLKRSGISASQENLSGMLGVRAAKLHMTNDDWRRANRLEPEGIERAIARCMGDVRQHKQMRAEMTARGWLGPPKVWRPDVNGYRIPGYTP